MMYATLFACAILFIVPILFVWNKVYQDGFVGRVALIGISFAALVFAFRIVNGEITHLWPETELLVISFAVFLCWHLWRFHSRVLTSKRAQEGAIERRMHRNGA